VTVEDPVHYPVYWISNREYDGNVFLAVQSRLTA
jgi:hypothetical protein